MGLHLKRQGRCTFSVSTRDRKGHSLEWLKESRLSSTVQQEKNRDPPQVRYYSDLLFASFHSLNTIETRVPYNRDGRPHV